MASCAMALHRSRTVTASTSCPQSPEGERMTELAVGTKKGLFVLEGEPGAPFEVAHRVFAGEPVEYAMRDARSGRLFAAVSSPIYGPKVWCTDDPGGEWTQCEGFALPAGGEQALERLWVIVAGEAEG